MEFLNKLEKTVFGWFKTAPNLPKDVRKWLGENVWWIAIIGVIINGINILRGLSYLEKQASLQGTVASTWAASSVQSDWAILTVIVSVSFLVLEVVLLFLAIRPLREKQKKGWVLLFASWLVSGAALLVNATLTFGIFSFIITILFGAVWLAILGYFLFEIHGEFAHVERSKGVKKAK